MLNLTKYFNVGAAVLSGCLLTLAFNNCGKTGEETAASSVVSNDIGSKFSGTLSSNINYVTVLGTVWGYALDPVNPGSSIKVIFYVDGVVGTGQLAGEVQANRVSPGPSTGHYFSFQIPARFLDGKAHSIYAYGYEAKPSLLVKPGGVNFTGYSPKAEAVFNVQIKNFVGSRCSNCHGWDYMGLYSGPLLNPTPAAGGSASNNLFYRKMAGLTGHAGGVFCPNAAADLFCAEIQKWYNAEFN